MIDPKTGFLSREVGKSDILSAIRGNHVKASGVAMRFGMVVGRLGMVVGLLMIPGRRAVAYSGDSLHDVGKNGVERSDSKLQVDRSLPRPSGDSIPMVAMDRTVGSEIDGVDQIAVSPGLEDLPPVKVDESVSMLAEGSPVLELDLAAAIAGALESNPGLAAGEMDIDAARWRYYQERAQYTAHLTGTRSYTSQTAAPSLGTFRIGSGEVDTRRLQVDQSIYAFGRQTNGIKQKRHETEAVRSTYRNSRHDLILQVKETYYGILLQTVLIRNARQSLQELKTQYDQSMARYEAGAATQFDVLLARSQLANARPPLIRALHDLEIGNQNMLTLLGIDGLRQVKLTGQFEPVVPFVGYEAALNFAYGRRQDLAALHQQLQATRRQIRVLRATHYPTLQGTAAHDISKGQRFPVDQSVEINSVVFSLSVPFYDGGQSHARMREAEATARKFEQQIQSLRLQIRNDVVRTFLTIEGASELIDAANEGLVSASKALYDANIGYEAGVRTSLEVLDAQTKLTTARTSLSQAQHDYSVARARFERVIAAE